MNARRRRNSHRSRAALSWGLLWLVALQAGMYWAVDRWPQFRDPEYGFKLARLRAQLETAPERPLALLLGSSRTGVGVDPVAFPTLLSDSTLAFNFSMTGAAPIQQLMVLRELLSGGIRPRQVLVEIHALLLNQQFDFAREEARIDSHRLSRPAMNFLCDYSRRPWSLRCDWWKNRLLPWYAFRHQLLELCVPCWCARPPQYAGYVQTGALGWLPFPKVGDDEESRRKWIDRSRVEYQEVLSTFTVTDDPDRALRGLLELCASERIGVTLFLMPEASCFRGWYPPWARPQLAQYLESLRRKYGFGLHDLTVSMPDDAFADGHHLLADSVADFSRLFARRVLTAALADDRRAYRAPPTPVRAAAGGEKLSR